MKPQSKNSEKYILFGILGITVILRAVYINWGLPDLFEEATPLRIALGFLNADGDGFKFNPHFFNYPALTFYVQFAAQLLHYYLGHITGIYPTLQQFITETSPVVLVARSVSVLFDAGTVYLVYLFTKEFIDNKTALFAALLIGINPLHIEHAHFIGVDTPLTFFTTLAFLFIFRLYSHPTQKVYLLAGISIGLAAATKYTGAFLLPVLFGIHALRHASLRDAIRSFLDPRIYKSLISSAIVFLLFNPYLLLDFGQFKKDFSFEQFHVSYGHLGIDQSQSTFMFYAGHIFQSVYGIILSVIIAVTIISYFIKRQKFRLIFLLFPAIYFTIVATWEMRADRYILPIIPVLGIIAADGSMRISERIRSFLEKISVLSVRSGVYAHTALVITICAGIVQPALTTAEFLASFTLPDTRTVTKAWIKQNIPGGSVIATGPYGVELPDSLYWNFPIPFLAVECERVAPFYDTRWYEDTDLLITSSFDRDRYFNEPEKYKNFLPFYDSLRIKWKLVYSVEPEKRQNGPSFWLYRFPGSAERKYFDTLLFQRLYQFPESTRISMFMTELANIEFHKGKFEKSGQILSEILSVEINNYPLRNRLAQVMYNLGNYAGALNQLQISIQANQNQPDVLALAGSALLRVNQPTTAEGVLHRAIQLDPSIDLPYEELIQIYTKLQNKPKLLDILKKYLKFLPPEGERATAIKNLMRQVERLP